MNTEKITIDTEKHLKKDHWDQVLKSLDMIGDKRGYPIDSGIKEVVTAFMVNDFPTLESCEGHVEERFDHLVKLRPYIDVSLGTPKLRHVGEEKIKKNIADKFNILPDQIEENDAASKEYWQYISDNAIPETPEYIENRLNNEKIEIRAQNLIVEFYKHRIVSDQARLITMGIGPSGHFRLTTSKENTYNFKETETSEHIKDLELEQKEI